MRAAEEQLTADYDAAMKQFCFDPRGPQFSKQMYCLGVVMGALALKQFAEIPESRLLPGMQPEESMEAYYETARRHLHAD